MPFLFLNVSTHPMRDFYCVFSQFYNECLHPPDEGINPSSDGWRRPHQVVSLMQWVGTKFLAGIN